MSTKSTITISSNKEYNDFGYKTIYCHFDGYPSGVGAMLLKHYDTPEKVEALIALGSLSCLRERIAPTADENHSFKEPVNDVTVAYHRDRCESMVISHYDTLSDLTQDLEEYNYLFEDGRWYTIESAIEYRLRPLLVCLE